MSDLIKREDAIKAIEELPNAYNGWSDAYDKAYIIGTLEEVPSAETEIEIIRAEAYVKGIDSERKRISDWCRPQGEWIDAEIPLESGGSMPIQACSLCKTFYPLAYTGGGHRFCPNCGARMKGADDERVR